MCAKPVQYMKLSTSEMKEMHFRQRKAVENY